MSLSPLPRGVYPSVTHIPPAALAARGIKLVLADLDNTLAPYGETCPSPEIRAWKAGLEAEGIALFLLSNSRKPARVKHYAETLGIPCQGHSRKPGTGGFFRAMEAMGRTPEETAMVGDQIFTDILGARRSGVLALMVEPIELRGNPGRYLRYAAETPFRALGRRNNRRDT